MITKLEEFLKVGQQIKISCKGFSFSAIVASAEEDKILVMGNKNPYVEVSTGEVLEIGANQEDDALYYLNALPSEVVYRGKVFFMLLRVINEPVRYQRRESRRVPVFRKAYFIPLSDREFWEGMIFNISENGMLLAAKEPLCLGSEAYISYEDTGDRERRLVGVMGKIVRRHLPETEEELGWWNYYYGLMFKNPLRKPGFSALC